MAEYFIILLLTVPLLNFIIPNKTINKYRIYIALAAWLLSIIVISGLRGDFTADSLSYQKIFKDFHEGEWRDFLSSFNLDYQLHGTEIGYVLLNFLVGVFTDNYIYLQTLVAIITYIPIVIWCRKSNDIGLSLCMFLAIGTYIESLNTVRNIMAASIYIFAIRYIYAGEVKKYICIVIIASTIHMSVLMMLPFYFILRLKPSRKLFITYSIIMMFACFNIEFFATLYNKYFFVASDTQGLMDLIYRRQVNALNVVFPISIVVFSVFVFLESSPINIFKDYKNRVILNGAFIWGLLEASMFSTIYFSRFACYLSPFILLLTPIALERIEWRKRIIISIFLYVACGVYFSSISKSYGEYYLFR